VGNPKIGGREGFIPLSEVLELKRFSNTPEYPYLRKYPSLEGALWLLESQSAHKFYCSTLTTPSIALKHSLYFLVAFPSFVSSTSKTSP
jgi:hypothetical protein